MIYSLRMSQIFLLPIFRVHEHCQYHQHNAETKKLWRLHLQVDTGKFENINAKLRKYDVVEYDHSTGKYRIIKREQVKRRTKHYG